MNAQRPVDEDAEFDQVCRKIDDALPRVRARSKTPTGGFRPEDFRRAQQTFVEMREDSVLTESGEDIKLTPEELEAAEREKEANARERRSRMKGGSGKWNSPPGATRSLPS